MTYHVMLSAIQWDTDCEPRLHSQAHIFILLYTNMPKHSIRMPGSMLCDAHTYSCVMCRVFGCRHRHRLLGGAGNQHGQGRGRPVIRAQVQGLK